MKQNFAYFAQPLAFSAVQSFSTGQSAQRNFCIIRGSLYWLNNTQNSFVYPWPSTQWIIALTVILPSSQT